MAKHYTTVTASNLTTIQTNVLGVIPDSMKTSSGFTFLNRLSDTAVFDSVKTEITSILTSEGVNDEVYDIAVYAMNGGGSFDIHTNPPTTGVNAARYIIPLENCDSMYYDFYSATAAAMAASLTLDGTANAYNQFALADCTLLESAAFTGVLLTNTTAPYAPRNAGTNTAICLSVFLDETTDLSSRIPDYV